jgi:RNA polymerase sigma-70 factor (ECF subfamily)
MMVTHEREGMLIGEAIDETQILAKACANPAEFAPLYARYFPRIYAYCLRRVAQSAEAEDLTSLIFTRALTGMHGYQGGSVAAWLFQIAHNTCMNHIRDARLRSSHVGRTTTALEEFPDPSELPLMHLVRAEDRERVDRLIAALPEAQRELLALRVAGELSAKEIGAVLGKSEGAVRVALYRTMQQLRAAYEQFETEDRQ